MSTASDASQAVELPPGDIGPTDDEVGYSDGLVRSIVAAAIAQDRAARAQAEPVAWREALQDALEFIEHYSHAWNGVAAKHPNTIATNARNALAARAQAEPVAWRKHVEQRLHSWRQRFVNKSGDQLALDDFMDAQSIEDLLDYVLDEWAEPAARAQGAGEAHQIITLCGSARFERLFKAWNEALTMAGHTVFGLTAYPSDKAGVKQWYTDEQKTALDAAHFRKIEASDAIFVINRNAYIGHSTMNEIEHAREHGKAIYFLESWGKGNGPIDSPSPIDTTTRSGSRCPWSSQLLGPAGAVRNAIVELTRGAESLTTPTIPQAVEVPGFVLVPLETLSRWRKWCLGYEWPGKDWDSYDVYLAIADEIRTKYEIGAPTPTASAAKAEGEADWCDADDGVVADALRKLLHREPTLREVTDIQKACAPLKIQPPSEADRPMCERTCVMGQCRDAGRCQHPEQLAREADRTRASGEVQS